LKVLTLPCLSAAFPGAFSTTFGLMWLEIDLAEVEEEEEEE